MRAGLAFRLSAAKSKRSRSLNGISETFCFSYRDRFCSLFPKIGSSADSKIHEELGLHSVAPSWVLANPHAATQVLNPEYNVVPDLDVGAAYPSFLLLLGFQKCYVH